MLALEEDEWHMILRALEDCPAGLAQLRAPLARKQYQWVQGEGLS